jgi:hypothetical protein
MKKSLISLLCFFFCFTLHAQSVKSDTIFTARLDTILCTINIIDQNSIYYTTLNNKQEEIALKRVLYYVKQPIVAVAGPSIPILINDNRPPLDSVLMSQEINYMKTCFTNFHSQYKKGVAISIIGIAISATGGFLMNQESSTDFEQAVVGAGALTTLIGGIVTINSHKWIGRAGLGLTGNGIGVRYIFK